MIAIVAGLALVFVVRSRKRPSATFVRVYDFDTKTMTSIPAAELAPGMIYAEIQGIGSAWVNASELKQGGYRHPPFSEAVRQELRDIKSALDEVYLLTLEDWEDGFRRDQNAEQQIAIWKHIASVYRRCASAAFLSPEQRRETFWVIGACLNSPREHVLQTVELSTLTRDQALDVMEMCYSRK